MKILLLFSILLYVLGCAHTTNSNFQRNVAQSKDEFEIVDFKNPSISALINNSKLFFKTNSLGEISASLDTAEPINFYTINKFEENDLRGKVNPRILEVLQIKNENGNYAKFALVFSDIGEPLHMYSAFPSAIKQCVPYVFFKHGTYNLFYRATSKDADLQFLGYQVMREFSLKLKEHRLNTGFEEATLSLAPIFDNLYQEQSIKIRAGKVLMENEIKKVAKSLLVPGTTNIYVDFDSIAYPEFSFINNEENCKVIK